jgi:hypothetical protein
MVLVPNQLSLGGPYSRRHYGGAVRRLQLFSLQSGYEKISISGVEGENSGAHIRLRDDFFGCPSNSPLMER